MNLTLALFLLCTFSIFVCAAAHSGTMTVVTALYDIHRTDRSFSSYLSWFPGTLNMLSKYPMIVFCKDRVVGDMVWNARSKLPSNMTAVVLENQYPLYPLLPSFMPLFAAHESHRVDSEWHPEYENHEYILVQFSKFVWMQKAVSQNYLPPTSHYMWVDAGISRFMTWEQWFFSLKPVTFPHVYQNHLSPVVCIQTVYIHMEDVPSSSAFLEAFGKRSNLFKGGMFGGTREAIEWLSAKVLDILQKDMMDKYILDNEQAAMALLYARQPNRFEILFPSDFGASDYDYGCNFICL